MYQELYKKSISNAECQAVRRAALLKEQKEKRASQQDTNRDLENVVAMSEQRIIPLGSDMKRHFKPISFRDIYHTHHALQQSEWLRERPEDLSNWLLVPCPKGQRCMVVACHGHTQMFNKNGRLQMRFRSLLPGDRNGRSSISMLDCIYVKDLKTFYILDALGFGKQDLTGCDAEFRFFWIKSKCEELNMTQSCDKNKFRFLCLDQHNLEDSANISSVLRRYPIWANNKPSLDGFLFYHKDANYTCGTTPLVGWLFPFMVPEVLGYAVSCEYEIPTNYGDCLQYIEMFDAKKHSKKERMKSQPMLMDETEDEEKDSSLQSVIDAQRNLELEVDCAEELNC